MIDRTKFFEIVRKQFGSLRQTQVDGFNKILDEWGRGEYDDIRWLAYMLATVWHETATQMQPIREEGSEAYLRAKPYYPWVGEGLVQVTWANNARKFGATKPGDLLKWPVALDALFRGMTLGMFRPGHKLDTYFNDRKWTGRHSPEYAARAIIQGEQSKAMQVAQYYRMFMEALK
jgi:hypothetical protein